MNKIIPTQSKSRVKLEKNIPIECNFSMKPKEVWNKLIELKYLNQVDEFRLVS